MLKKTGLIIFICFMLVLFKGCDVLNGVPDKDLIDKIDDQIAWQNAKQLDVTIDFPDDWGKSAQKGFKRVGDVRKGFPFEVEFFPDDDYAIIGWRAYRTEDLRQVPRWKENPVNYLHGIETLTDVVLPEVDKYGNGSEAYSITLNVEEPVTLIPYSNEQPRITQIGWDTEVGSRPRGSRIRIQFAGNIKNYGFGQNQVNLTGGTDTENHNNVFRSDSGGTHVTQYYQIPEFENRWLTILPNSATPPPADTLITLRLGAGITTSGGRGLPADKIDSLYTFSWTTFKDVIGILSWEAEYDKDNNQIIVKITYRGDRDSFPRAALYYNLTRGDPLNPDGHPPHPDEPYPYDITNGGEFIAGEKIGENFDDVLGNYDIYECVLAFTTAPFFNGSHGSGRGYNIQIALKADDEIMDTVDELGDISAFQMFNVPGLKSNNSNRIIVLSDPADLRTINTSESDGRSYVLDSGNDNFDTGNWAPVGTAASPFRGTFYGMGTRYTVSSLTASDYMGLFGYTDGANIHDLNVTYSAAQTINNAHFGGIAGLANNTMINNSNVVYNAAINLTKTGSDDDANARAWGGVAGALTGTSELNSVKVTGSGVLSNTSSDGVVHLGGIAGRASGNGVKIIRNSSSEINITAVKNNAGNVRAGGIVGYTDSNGVSLNNVDYGVTGSTTSGKITVSGDGTGIFTIGGIAGLASGNLKADTVRSLSERTIEANVKGTAYVGGFAGSVNTNTIEVANSSSVTPVDVQGASSGEIGGFAGRIEAGGSFINSYATGNVKAGDTTPITGQLYVGGFAGYSTGPVEASYATGTVTAVNSSNGNFDVGGLIGRAVNGSITRSWASGKVTATRTVSGTALGAGGLVGFTHTSSGMTVSINNSYALGDVELIDDAGSGSPAAGGLVGVLNGSSGINYSFARGSVAARSARATPATGDGVLAGGLFGWKSGESTVQNSAALGDEVIATSGGAALDVYRIGRKAGTGAFANNYARANMLIGSSSAGKDAGVTTAVVTASIDDKDTANGASVLVSSLKNTTFWTRNNLLAFNASTWDTSVLTMGHPRLSGVGDQPASGVMTASEEIVTITEYSSGAKGPYGVLKLEKRDPLESAATGWEEFASGSLIEQSQPVRVTVTYNQTNTGYELSGLNSSGVTLTGSGLTSAAVRTFDMPGNPVVITATFTALPQTITMASPTPVVKGELRGSYTVGGTAHTEATKTSQTDATHAIVTTPAEGYELNTITITNTTTGEDVTGAYYDAASNILTVPHFAVTVTVTFKPMPQTVTLTPPAPLVGGELRGSYRVGTTNSGTANVQTQSPTDSTLVIETTPAAGYALGAVTIRRTASPFTDVTSECFDGTTLTIPPYGVTVSVTFTALPQPLTREALVNGEIKVTKQDGTVIIANGSTEITVGETNNPAPPVTDSTVTIDITSVAGCEIYSVTITKKSGGELYSKTYDPEEAAADTYTFTMPAGGVNVSAVFLAIPQPVKVNMTGKGTVTVVYDDDGVDAELSTTVTIPELCKIRTYKAVSITAQADAGYSVTAISAVNSTGGSVLSGTGLGETVYRVISSMPDGGVTITVEFTAQPQDATRLLLSKGTLAIVNDGSTATLAAGSANATTTAPTDSNVTLTFVPDAGYWLSAYSVASKTNNTVTVKSETGLTTHETITETFTMPAGGVNISATFSPIPQTITLKMPSNGSYRVGTTNSSATANVTMTSPTDTSLTIDLSSSSGLGPSAGFKLDSIKITRDSDSSDVTSTYFDTTTNTLTVPPFYATVEVSFVRKQVPIYTYFNGTENQTNNSGAGTSSGGGTYTVTVDNAALVKGHFNNSRYETSQVVEIAISPTAGYRASVIQYEYTRAGVTGRQTISNVDGSGNLNTAGGWLTATSFKIPDDAQDETSLDIKLTFARKTVTMIRGPNEGGNFFLYGVPNNTTPGSSSTQNTGYQVTIDEVSPNTGYRVIRRYFVYTKEDGSEDIVDLIWISDIWGGTYAANIPNDVKHGTDLTVYVRFSNTYTVTANPPTGGPASSVYSYEISTSANNNRAAVFSNTTATPTNPYPSIETTPDSTITVTPSASDMPAGYRVSSVSVSPNRSVATLSGISTFSLPGSPADEYNVYVTYAPKTYTVSSPGGSQNVTYTAGPITNIVGTFTVSAVGGAYVGNDITITPSITTAGYELDTITVTHDDTNFGYVPVDIPVTITNGVGTFTLPDLAHNATITIAVRAKKTTYTISPELDTLTAGTNGSFTLTQTAGAALQVGNSVTLTASYITQGYRLGSVTINGGTPIPIPIASGNTYTFNIDDHIPSGNQITVSAVFVPKTYSISPAHEATGNIILDGTSTVVGTFTVNAPTVAFDQSVSISNNFTVAGYQFKSLTYTLAGYNSGNANTITSTSFNIPDGDQGATIYITNVIAEKIQYGITTSPSPTAGGSISITGGITQAGVGDSVSFTVSANSGYRIKSGSVNASGGVTNWSFNEGTGGGSFTMPAGAVTINAEFEQLFAISKTSAGTGTGTITGPDSAAAGDTISFTITAGAGSVLASVVWSRTGGGQPWTGTPSDVGNVFSNTMPGHGITVTATFNLIPTYDITIDLGATGPDDKSASITIDDVPAGSTTAKAMSGQSVSFTINAGTSAAIYYIGVQGSLGANPTLSPAVPDYSGNDVITSTHTFIMPSESVTISASINTISPSILPGPARTPIQQALPWLTSRRSPASTSETSRQPTATQAPSATTQNTARRGGMPSDLQLTINNEQLTMNRTANPNSVVVRAESNEQLAINNEQLTMNNSMHNAQFTMHNEEETVHELHELNELNEADTVTAAEEEQNAGQGIPPSLFFITLALYLCLTGAMTIAGIRRRRI